uniref:Uncharacterized protein n=1 Tax=Pseudo-nitzschia australis TaxID=44445 RepID=A0A7S4EQU2_9STRA|mmetsp:Transcript_26412/g.57882  ORF Transcript_26412/g.57882 Transcript_26412/m.57882 type:complete len:337 (+) Transcript_26412:83-1093(+)
MAYSKSKTNLISSNQNEIEVEVELELENDHSLVASESADLNPQNSPTIINNTKYPIVVFLERGIIYNKCILEPREAVTMTRKQTGGGLLKLPYKVHAMIGDERSLPTRADSIKNVVKVSAVPAAFAAGCLITAVSGGMLCGPSAALAPLVSGLVVRGVVVDAAAMATGMLAANQTKKIAEVLQRDHNEKMVGVTSRLKPRERFLSVTGGLFEGPIVILEIPRCRFERMAIETIKVPIAPTEITEEKEDESILLFSDETAEDSTNSTCTTNEIEETKLELIRTIEKLGKNEKICLGQGKENEEHFASEENQSQISETKNSLFGLFRLQRKMSTSRTN